MEENHITEENNTTEKEKQPENKVELKEEPNTPEKKMSGSGDHDDESYVVKLRGLPWSTTVDEILQFFNDCSIKDGKLGIHMTMSREGRPSGEAYVEMETDEDIEKACKKDRDHIGHRYIEVFKVKRSEMEWVVKRSGLNLENAMDDGCVRLRGLPFGCSKEEIAQFFSGLEIVPNGISLPTDFTGRSTGEAYVQFVNKEVAEKALQKHKDKIGHRYIEIFRSSLSEVRAAIGPKMRPLGPGGFNQRPAPYDRGDRFGGINRYNSMGRSSRSFKGGFGDFDDGPSPWGMNSSWGGSGGPGLRGSMGGRGSSSFSLSMNSGGFGGSMGMGRGGRSGGGGSWNGGGGGGMGGGGHCIHMRGLPFRATQVDVADFFRPVIPLNIRLLYDSSGRASGEADVEFATHEEAVKAMSKDKGHMQHRYIELFLNSSPGGSGGMGGSSFGMGGGGFGSGGFGGGGGGGGGGGFGGDLERGFRRDYSNSFGNGMGYGNQMRSRSPY